jgi:hypothetical protein
MPTVQEEKAPYGHSVQVAKSGDSYTVKDRPVDHVMVEIEIGVGEVQIQMPDGFAYDAGDTVLLTLEQVDELNSALFTAGTLINNGFVSAIQSEGSVASIVIDGADADDSIAALATNQYTATVTYINGDTEDFDETNSAAAGVVWASATVAAATIDGDGLATGVAAGTTLISASFRGVTSPPLLLTVT